MHIGILSQSSSGEGWQDEASLVDSLVVVSTKLVLFLRSPATQWLGDIALGVLAADHEADLAGWVGGDGGVGVLDGWEDLLAVGLQLGDEWEVKPLVFGC
jgi:hypothetical protein